MTDSIKMTVASYNQVPAKWRRTEGGINYVFVGSKEWKRVEFTK